MKFNLRIIKRKFFGFLRAKLKVYSFFIIMVSYICIVLFPFYIFGLNISSDSHYSVHLI